MAELNTNNGKVSLRSIINTYIPMELYVKLMKLTMMSTIDNNEKGTRLREYLTEYNVPYEPLGSGTNRVAMLIEGYAVKFALDKDGMIDNRREMLYAKALYPSVVKVYECVPNGLIAVTEYVTIFELEDFRKYQEGMRKILKEISNSFLIGDVGITTKNYVNWGIRRDGTICILDFAYIYSVKYSLFKCSSCNQDALLRYDNDYVMLKCPVCGRKYGFKDIRKRVTKTQQEEEIGDIRRLGYNLHKGTEIKDVIEAFVPDTGKKKKKEKEHVLTAKERKELEKASPDYQDWDYPTQEEIDNQDYE